MSGAVRLRFSELGLYNRDRELLVLKECYRRVQGNGDDADAAAGVVGSSEVVLVAGRAGTGKSSLIRCLADIDAESEHMVAPLFVSGKFDDPRATTGQPYAALRNALGELVERIIESCNQTDQNKMKDAINMALGSESVEVLGKVVPGIEKLVAGKEDDETTSTAAGHRLNSSEAFNRLKFALRSFLRSVCSPLNPVVLFLDDLQWGDQASLHLIRAIVCDTKLRHLLFVGAYREEEVDKVFHPLSVLARDIDQNKLLKPITRIHVMNLDVSTIRKLISGLLRLDESEVSELTDVVYQRTGGNAFFVTQFLSMLQDRDFISYSITEYKWKFDIDQIREETNISDNVIDFVARKIQRLPDRMMVVLKLMACFPSTKVEVSFLETILQGLELEEFSDVRDTSDLVDVLEEAIEEGLVDRIGVDAYRFTHDRVREGAYSLITTGSERDIFHLRIGELVLKIMKSEAEQQQWMKFVAADQLNHGVAYITDETQKLDLIVLNLEAGESAMSVSAFVPASDFFQKGISLLCADEGHWKQNYDVSLKLYSFAADAAHCTGDYQLHRRMVDEVLTNAKSLDDKLPVYCGLVESLTAQQKLGEVMETGLLVLAKLGHHFPSRFLAYHVNAALRKTKRMLRQYSDDDLLSLPHLEDKNVVIAARLMMNLARASFFLQMPEYMMLFLFGHLQLMLRYGANGDIPYAFVTYGLLLCGKLEDITEGYRFGKLALKLLEQYHDQESRVLLLAHSFVIHWQKPVQGSLDQLLRAHKVGMASGDVVNAFLCCVAYGYFYYHAGLPLGPLEIDVRAYCQQMQEYKQEVAYMELAPLWQGVLNLQGRSEDPLVLSGEAMIQDEFLRDAKERRIPTATQKVVFVRMQLAYYFGDIDLAAELQESCEKLTATISAHLVYEVFTFFSGLIFLEQARRTNKKKYKKKALSIIKKMKGWVVNRSVNTVHKLWILEAEYSTTLNVKKSRAQRDKIMRTYDTAVSAAARSGIIHDAALANERAGVWFKALGDEYWASSYLTRAHKLYHEWGARAKADHLLSQYSLEISQVADSSTGVFAKGRSRFDAKNSQQHKEVSFTELANRNSASRSENLVLKRISANSVTKQSSSDLDRQSTSSGASALR